MANRIPKKKKNEFVPGTVVKCESGRYIAFYKHRTDIIANGENEADAKNNLKKMYKTVKKYEDAEEEKQSLILSKSYQTKRFTERLDFI